ncbi:MAG: taurine catabolism dioxygenase TauD [Gammaproteobacteria bacterium]|nr:MAG: taurine catabolism dioxygenase TauD [Gammaproteobacteria bacterium]
MRVYGSVRTPWEPGESEAYRRWRDAKLAAYPQRVEDLMVEIQNPRALTPAEKEAILSRCRRANMAIYKSSRALSKEDVRSLGRQLGLVRLDGNLCADEDGITSLCVRPHGVHRHYIPYTDRPLSWHTDGYYNEPPNRVRAFITHCASPAAEGGENSLLDHEIAYILLREENPDFVAAWMAEDAMTIPPNGAIRGARTGAVFAVVGGHLHMRYTARQHNIQWHPRAKEAADRFAALLAKPLPYRFNYRLAPGEGIVCNNVLHNRAGFKNGDGQERLVYRARYYDRISENAQA